MKNLFVLVSTIILAIIFTGCFGPSESDSRKDELKKKYGCNDIDDCLSKYEFEGARAYVEVTWEGQGELLKISNSEAEYWISEGDFDRAFKVAKEYKHEWDMESEELNFQYRIILSIVNELIGQEKFKEAKKWALKASSERNSEGWLPDQTNDFRETAQKTLLNKIDEAEKILAE